MLEKLAELFKLAPRQFWAVEQQIEIFKDMFGSFSLKGFFASILAIGGAYGAFYLFSSAPVSEAVAFVASMIVAVLMYALLAFLLGILTRDDVTSIPLLNRLVRQK